MQIVINIPQSNYKAICVNKSLWETEPKHIIYSAIAKGTPLPKGHGRLIDADELKKSERLWSCDYEPDGYSHVVEIQDIDTVPTIIEADKEQEDWHGKRSSDEKAYKDFCKDYLKLRDTWNCSSCEHTEDECKDCYPELGYKNNKLERDTEAVSEFVESDAFKKLMGSLEQADDAPNTNKSDKEMLVEAGTKPIGLTKEMLGIEETGAVIAGRNKKRGIEDVKDYIAKELEAEYQRGYQDGLQHKSHPAEKARHNIIKCCLEDIMNTIDATPEELRKALEDL